MSSNKQRVIILNGPMGIGKDTIGKLLQAALGDAVVCEFKNRLIELALSISGISQEVWDLRYTNRETKESPWHLLGGLSQREFLIKVSEEWIKPVFGERYFGEFMHAEVINSQCDTIITDGGFNEEVRPMLANSELEVYCFQLEREGYAYDERDSRGYITNVTRTFDVPLTDGKPLVAVSHILRLLEASHSQDALDFGLHDHEANAA